MLSWSGPGKFRTFEQGIPPVIVHLAPWPFHLLNKLAVITFSFFSKVVTMITGADAHRKARQDPE